MDDPTPPDTDMKVACAKVFISWLCVLASMKLADWTLLVGLISGVMAAIFTGLQIFVLWRDKIRKHRYED